MSECFVKINTYFKGLDLNIIKWIVIKENCRVCGKPMTIKGYTSSSFFYLSDPAFFCSKKCMVK